MKPCGVGTRRAPESAQGPTRGGCVRREPGRELAAAEPAAEPAAADAERGAGALLGRRSRRGAVLS